MVRSALFARVSNHETIHATLILRDAAKRPLLRMRCHSALPSHGDSEHDHRRQTGAAATASPEMAGVRQARTGPDDPVRHIVLRLLPLGDPRPPHPPPPPSPAVAAAS